MSSSSHPRPPAALPRRRNRAAFTLIELMIVVCIIGVLASIAIPSFAAYMKKAKATEVPTNIGLIFKGMAVYWEAPKSGQGLGSTTAGHCPVNDGGFMGGPMPPFPPGPEPRTADWASGHGYAEVGFMPSTPVYAVYAWGHAPANDPEPLYGANPCGLTEADLNDPILNVIWGATDLDGDGLIGGFTVQTTLRGDQLAREPGFGTIDSAFLALGMGACPMCAADFID